MVQFRSEIYCTSIYGSRYLCVRILYIHFGYCTICLFRFYPSLKSFSNVKNLSKLFLRLDLDGEIKKNMSNVLWKYQWFPFYSYRYDALDEMVFNFSELSILNEEHRHPVQTRETKKNSYTKILNAITSIYDEHISNVFQFEWIEWAHFYRMCLNREILDLLPCLVRTKNKHIGVSDTLEWVTHLNGKKEQKHLRIFEMRSLKILGTGKPKVPLYENMRWNFRSSIFSPVIIWCKLKTNILTFLRCNRIHLEKGKKLFPSYDFFQAMKINHEIVSKLWKLTTTKSVFFHPIENK